MVILGYEWPIATGIPIYLIISNISSCVHFDLDSDKTFKNLFWYQLIQSDWIWHSLIEFDLLTGLVLLDVWNVIEAFRENGLTSQSDLDVTISKAKLEALLTSIYGALAKRLPPPGSVTNSGPGNTISQSNSAKDLQAMASWLFNWLFNALKPAGASSIKVSLIRSFICDIT